MDDKLYAWLSYKQGLDGRLRGSTAGEVLTQTGWARSVAGSSPYLTLFARAGLRRAEVDADLAARSIHELPSARGCTYVIPSEHYALALACSDGFASKTEVAVARKLGVTDEEIARLKAAVLKALDGGELDPDGLKAKVGDASRSLGPEGAKKGLTTTLPLALGLLQSEGEIRRVPVNGRIDQQRYRYARWTPNPRAQSDQVSPYTELARLYWGWIGAAAPADFQWFSGLGVKAAKTAMEPLGLASLEQDLLALPEDREAYAKFRAPTEPQYVLTGILDNTVHLRLQAKADELSSHAILDRGRVVGLWDFDPDNGDIAWASFGKRTPALKKAVAEMEAFVREDLGDARTFSLDSVKSRGPRLAKLRAAD